MDKYKVTMRNVSMLPDGNTATLEATDFVGADILEVYVADARTRWQFVGVSEEPVDPVDELRAAGAKDVSAAAAEEYTVPAHLVGKTAADFARFGDHSTPENALDEHIAATTRER